MGVKYQARVTNVADPKGFGRIKAEIIGFDGATTPWCYPCVPIAGPGYGFYFLPVVDDIVLVEQMADGRWVWTGCIWDAVNPKPTEGSATVRVLRTPAGHTLKFDESGDVELAHSAGSRLTLKANGDIEIEADSNVNINGSTAKVVTTAHVCAFTGAPHVQGSATVKADGAI